MQDNETERTHRVPSSDGPLAELQADVKTILAHVGGSYDAHGEHHPGLSHRVRRLENIVTWVFGVGTVVITALLVAFGTGTIGGKH